MYSDWASRRTNKSLYYSQILSAPCSCIEIEPQDGQINPWLTWRPLPPPSCPWCWVTWPAGSSRCWPPPPPWWDQSEARCWVSGPIRGQIVTWVTPVSSWSAWLSATGGRAWCVMPGNIIISTNGSGHVTCHSVCYASVTPLPRSLECWIGLGFNHWQLNATSIASKSSNQENVLWLYS